MKGSVLHKKTDLILKMNKKRNNYCELPDVLTFSICECQPYMSSYESRKRGRANKQNPLKNVVFWDVVLCTSCVNRSFGGKYIVGCFQLMAISSHLLTLVPRSKIFYPEDVGDTFLRNS
jgi:hypothetical protein